jgi:poly-gamma-glutamate synthesis protein (capsule biosynthesis protein)
LVVPTGSHTLAIIAMAEHEFVVATRNSSGVCPLSLEDAMRVIRSLRSLGHDVVVLVHGGNEHHPLPRPGLRETCRFMVDCGAAAVLCAHSHVMGPLEWYAGAPILYGLGNLYFPTPGMDQPAGWSEGLCAMLGFGEKGIIEVVLVPTRFDGASGISPVTEPAARELATRLEAMSRVVADDDALESEWRRYVEDNSRHYLSCLLGLTRLERLGLRAGIWPWWRMPRGRTADLLNVVSCESHREALIALLQDVVDGR